MTNHTDATRHARRVQLLAWARASRLQRRAEGRRLEYWPHIEGLDVIESWLAPEGFRDGRQVHTMLLCDQARRAFA